jgi:hypothetical protein
MTSSTASRSPSINRNPRWVVPRQITVRVIVMGRNTHKAPRTMTLTAAFESQESSCARLFEKGPLDHEIEESCLSSNRSTCSVQNTFRKSAIEASSDSEGRPRLSFVIVWLSQPAARALAASFLANVLKFACVLPPWRLFYVLLSCRALLPCSHNSS